MSGTGGHSTLAGLKKTSRLYIKSRLGMIGLLIIVFFVVLAVFAPWLGPNDPLATSVASSFDVPGWSTVFPQYNNLAIDQVPIKATFNSPSDLNSWTYTGSSVSKSFQSLTPSTRLPYSGYVVVNSSIDENTAPSPNNQQLSGGQAFFDMSQPFQFSGTPPTAFAASVTFNLLKSHNVSTIYVNMLITDPKGVNYSMASTTPPALDTQIEYGSYQNNTWNNVVVSSGLLPLSGIPAFNGATPPPKVIFTQAGTYIFTVEIQGVAVEGATAPSMSVGIASAQLHLNGGAFGLLGTDNFGRDVWSQFVWGSQISLLIGILSGVGSVGIGAAIGIAGGYLGGKWDEGVGRVTDFFLVLPFLPLLIIVSTLIATNQALYKNIYLWIIVVFMVLSWPFIARIVRAQVLSVKERQYVEASRALGSGTGHIMRKHILPNVMGLVYSQVALNVAGFILTEAALDFLSISIHGVRQITWGLMITYSLTYAVHHPDLSYVWWWFFPPGLSIAALSLAFVLVGYALDSIFNPRLRAR